jgi:DASS family divalent anion:Na+ symporter
MEPAPEAVVETPQNNPEDPFSSRPRHRAIRWALVLLTGTIVLLIPSPAGIPPQSWRLFAIFVSTVMGLILQPLPGGAIVLFGVLALPLFRAVPVNQALAGYSDPLVWLVLAAFFISRGMIKTGLGRRIALLFIRAIGHRTLGLGYALVATDMLLAMIIPSNAARSGGIVFPIAISLADAYESKPGPTSRRLGAFLIAMTYQCDVILCAMFLTGQSSNGLIAKLAKETSGFDLSAGHWALGAIVPGLLSLVLVPLMVYRIFPPEIKETPAAAEYARGELHRLGPMTRPQKIMLLVFCVVAVLWITSPLHGIHYAVVALLGISALLICGVLSWDDVIAERQAWDVFIWFGGLVGMAEALGQSGITRRFAESTAGFTLGWPWWAAVGILLLVYFYAHYGFASITAHAAAMYTPFLVVSLAAGAPPFLAALSFAYFSNLAASLTHYGTTPAPIYFGAGYVSQQTWWRLGLIASILNITIWVAIGFAWWKLLRWW